MDETEQAVLLKEISDLAKELRELSKAYQLMDWLDKNHPEGKKWPSYGAKFVSTLDKLIKEILGEN